MLVAGFFFCMIVVEKWTSEQDQTMQELREEVDQLKKAM
jgi:hypothetical protein